MRKLALLQQQASAEAAAAAPAEGAEIIDGEEAEGATGEWGWLLCCWLLCWLLCMLCPAPPWLVGPRAVAKAPPRCAPLLGRTSTTPTPGPPS